jgi:hypothetical protein
MLGGGLLMLTQCGDLREDGAGLASGEGCFQALGLPTHGKQP